MSASSQYIAIDIGAESGRCIIGTLEGSAVRFREAYRFRTPALEYDGHLYWDVLKIADEVRTSLRTAAEQTGAEVAGIGIDTWGVDYVLLDSNRRLLGYPYHYRDNRTDGIMGRTFRRISREEIYQITGCQFMQFNTLFQLVAEREQPVEFLAMADRILLMPNFLQYFLTGELLAEYTIASTTQLVNPGKRNWAWNLIEDLDLPQEIFPEIREPETVLGTLQAAIAKETGLQEGIPVVAGASHDTAAAVASVPASGEDWAFLSSGTWSLIGMELSDPLINGESLNKNFTNEGGIEGTTRFLKNIMGLWPVQECRRAWKAGGTDYDYATLEKAAQESKPAQAWIDVDDPRFLKPGGMPEKIIGYLRETGQPHREDTGWIIRCVLESLAFKYRLRLKEIEDLTERKVQKLHAVGGGIQNRLMNQLTADAIGCKVITGPVEGTALGNLGAQAIATGAVLDIHAYRDLVAGSVRLETYQPRSPEYWEKHESQYLEILAGTQA